MKMHTVQQLPEGYDIIEVIDLQKDKKTALIVNIVAVVVYFILFIAMNMVYPFYNWIDDLFEKGTFALNMIIMAVSYIAYIVAHEATHGLAMKHFGARKMQFGFTGLYAYAGSREDYFDKKAYICISLAPVVVWGVIFTLGMILLPDWFWIMSILQIANISGAAGDFFVTWKTLHYPDDMYVMDTGVNMTVYSKK